MSSADDVIADIDHALLDWSVSGDAMRWNPAAPPSQSRVQACAYCEGGIEQRDDDFDWWSTGDFGGTGTGALTEALYCLDSPDHRHHASMRPVRLTTAMLPEAFTATARTPQRSIGPLWAAGGVVRLTDATTGVAIEGVMATPSISIALDEPRDPEVHMYALYSSLTQGIISLTVQGDDLSQAAWHLLTGSPDPVVQARRSRQRAAYRTRRRRR